MQFANRWRSTLIAIINCGINKVQRVLCPTLFQMITTSFIFGDEQNVLGCSDAKLGPFPRARNEAVNHSLLGCHHCLVRWEVRRVFSHVVGLDVNIEQKNRLLCSHVLSKRQGNTKLDRARAKVSRLIEYWGILKIEFRDKVTRVPSASGQMTNWKLQGHNERYERTDPHPQPPG